MRLASLASLVALMLLAGGCASRSALGPEIGTITVGVNTQGTGIADLVFQVAISPAGAGGPIKADAGIFTARNAPAGTQTVRLSGLPARCQVDGASERTIVVSPQRSATVRFVVKCS